MHLWRNVLVSQNVTVDTQDDLVVLLKFAVCSSIKYLNEGNFALLWHFKSCKTIAYCKTMVKTWIRVEINCLFLIKFDVPAFSGLASLWRNISDRWSFQVVNKDCTRLFSIVVDMMEDIFEPYLTETGRFGKGKKISCISYGI